MNYEETHFFQFSTTQHNKFNVQIAVPGSVLPNVASTKFLELRIDSTLSWKGHILDLSAKLNKTCYAIRTVKSFMSLKALKTVYFSYFHSIMSYGVIFWGNSYVSKDIFIIQKRIIRILANKSRRVSCRHLFKQLQILTLPSQYIYSFLVFVIKNGELFSFNSEIHNLHTRFKNNLHLPSTNLSMVQKGVLYSGIKIFNYLPQQIKNHSGDLKSFKRKLKNFLIDHTLYSLDEFYNLSSFDRNF